jgi:hypothetical protein
MLDDAEQPDFAVLHGDDLRRVGRPHHVGCLSDDVPVMRHLAVWAGAVRRQQGVLAH